MSNFTQANMEKMEMAWPSLRTSLLSTANLLASFGYTRRTLTADSVMIPIAYYLHQRGLGQNYIDSSHHATDRLAIRQWVARLCFDRRGPRFGT